eukprot:scaffold10118_cov144-Chaetoceros_neogracile.AAC.1
MMMFATRMILVIFLPSGTLGMILSFSGKNHRSHILHFPKHSSSLLASMLILPLHPFNLHRRGWTNLMKRMKL